MGKLKVGIIEYDEQTRRDLLGYFAGRGYEVCFAADDGQSGAALAERSKPDALVMDVMMPGRDGSEVVERLRQNGFSAKILVFSALGQEACVTRAFRRGASYSVAKLVGAGTPESGLPGTTDAKLPVMEVKNKESVRREYVRLADTSKLTGGMSLEEELANIFISVGIPANIMGYRFLREGIRLAVETPDIVNAITKKLYPLVAERFGTTGSKVERAIRHAIEVAWNRGKLENINALFGVSVYSHNEKPTNSEFIALIADKLLIERTRYSDKGRGISAENPA
ncbi:MAG: sporulation transcription factor Spo0A [Clostridiales bacterium]|jgi:two-component system response regulator (stage 0 sporulation protein A)|nr:sporulation transcription factor Spo0A [Clostridiales bacterium]